MMSQRQETLTAVLNKLSMVNNKLQSNARTVAILSKASRGRMPVFCLISLYSCSSSISTMRLKSFTATHRTTCFLTCLLAISKYNKFGCPCIYVINMHVSGRASDLQLAIQQTLIFTDLKNYFFFLLLLECLTHSIN